MANETAHAEHVHAHPDFLQHHFDTPTKQFNASKLGMWVFIATEILMFGGLFGMQALPATWKIWLARTLSGATLLTAELLGGALLLAFDLLLISIAMARFQRARLILD